MAAGSVQIPPNSSGQLVDMVSLSVGGVDVVRQTFALANAGHGQTIAEVVGGSASTSAVGLVVRPATATVALVAGTTVNVNGGVAISGTAVVAGVVNISAMPTVTVTGGVAISGTAVVSGTVNISTMPSHLVSLTGTAIVAGVVGLTAGTANIGNLDFISRTVQVAIGTPYTLQGISTTVQVAIATPYILQGISTTVQVAIATPFIIQGISTSVTVVGNVNISTMPAVTGSVGINSISAGVSIAINAISAGVTIGINSISATVNTNLLAVSAGVAINTQARAPAVMSASRGPKCVTASTSANVTLIASPGAGANIYIKQLGVHNFSGTFISMRVGTSSSIQTIVAAAQSSGGGAVYNFDPPWMLSASEAALCSVKPNAAYGVFNVQFYVI